MSKKKGASRSAMTLKDFHGGSIPSDLPLPSAPGMTVDRSVFERQGSGTWMSPTLGRGYNNDRSSYHRQGSSTGVRTFEDKASYFPNPANIGRNYDEDERKPVDSRPRSSHSAERFDDHSYDERRGAGGYAADRYAVEDQANYSDSRGSGASERFPRSQVAGGGGFETDIYVHDEFGLIPVGPPPSRVLPPQDVPSRSQPSSYQREMVPEPRVEQSSYMQIQQQTTSAPPPYSPNQQIAASPPRSWKNPVQQTPASAPVSAESGTNVWTARRDGGDFNRTQVPEAVSDSQGSPAPWRPQSIVGRAVDKVSAGRWQADSSRPSPGRWQADSSRESVTKPSAAEEESAGGYGAYGADNVRQSYSEDLVERPRYVGTEPDRVVHSGTGRVPYDDGRPELIDQNKAGFRDAGRASFVSGGIGSSSSNGRFPSELLADRNRYSEGGEASLSIATETSRQSSQPEITERPKLKLLPRSKPLEKIETPTAESENVAGYEETTRNLRGLSDNIQQPEVPSPDGVFPKRDPAGANDEADRAERPKLNLKPRSQPQEAEPAEGSEKVRQSVFGGARPRELVLKERGVDDVVDVALTPGISSLPTSATPVAKVEAGNAAKTEKPETRADEKYESRRYERPERSYERQGSHHADRAPDGKWDREKDSQWDQERTDGPRRREFDRQDSRRDNESRRDIDKQDSWRKPAESPVSGPAVKSSGPALSSLVDPSPRGSGRFGYSSPASAVELAQAFTRSSSIGSTMTGSTRASNNLRTPLSPVPKSSVQGFVPGYGNGTASRDAPFSRLAEAAPPPFSASSGDTYLQYSGIGVDSQSGYFGSGKLGGYASNDLKRGSSFGRAETGRDFMEENGDFPGKRGLPVRQRDGYFD
ncbi:unnamed protein product [Calypogeia fissa]